MSYNTKYVAHFDSDNGNNIFDVKFLKDGWAGGITEVKLAGKGVKIDTKQPDWFTPIVLQSLSLTIIDDSSTTSGWYDLQDLRTLEEKEFKIIIDASYGSDHVILFDGFIDSKVVGQRYVNGGLFSLTASNYISKLDSVTPSLVKTIQKQAPINIIDESLQLTGKEASIYVNNTLDPSGATLTNTNTALNLTGLDTEIFWKNNVERDGAKKIIEKILTPFDSYLYYWNEIWYIERYGDLWTDDVSKHFVGYAMDGSYGFTDNGSAISIDSSVYSLPITGPGDEFEFVNDNQMVDMTPGLNTLELKIDTKKYLNLTINDFSDIDTTELTPLNTRPDKRQWKCLAVDGGTTGWQFPGYKWGILNASIGYSHYKEGEIPASWVQRYPGNSYQTIANAIYRYGAPSYYSGGVYQYSDKNRASLSTRFDITIEDANTSLNINWKYAPIGVGGAVTDFDYRCYYLIRQPPANRFVVYRPEGDFWEYTTNYNDASMYVEISGSDLDSQTGVGEIKTTIPIGDVSGWTLGDGDFELTLNILGEDIKASSATTWQSYAAYPLAAHYGDVIVSSTNATQNNRLGGVINTKTLEKKTLDVEIFDIANLNFRNGLFTEDDYGVRTSLWTDDSGDYYSIAEWILNNKLSLYHKNRQQIKSDMKSTKALPPLTKWLDETDPSTRKYIMTSSSYYPGQDLYSGCVWSEYSDDVMTMTYS